MPLTYGHIYAIIYEPSIVLAPDKKDGDRVTLDAPLSISIRIYEEKSPAIAAALKLMLENDKKPDGLIEAVLAGISPKYYVEAILLDHTHEQVMDNPLFVDPIYTNLRIKQGLSQAQAQEVYVVSTTTSRSFRGRSMRGAYRAAHKVGYAHSECMLAMKASEPGFYFRGSGPGMTFEDFLKKAVAAARRKGDELSINDIWRAWLTANNQEPYDVSEI